MADVKISGLPASTTPLAGTEVLPIVQGGQTRQVSVNNLTTGKTVSATQFISTIATGTAPLTVASTTEVANLRAANATSADTANQVKSNATTGVLQVTGPGAGTTRVMTTPNANFTVARTDAGQTFTGDEIFNDKISTGGTNGGQQQFNIVVPVFTSNASGGLRIGNNGNNYYTDYLFKTDGSANPYIQTTALAHVTSEYWYGGGNNEWRWFTNNSQKMKLTSGGNLSLDIGNLVIGTSGKGIDTSSAIPVTFNINNVEAARIHASRGVSIGNTTDPGVGSLRVNTVVQAGSSPKSLTTVTGNATSAAVRTVLYKTVVPAAASTVNIDIPLSDFDYDFPTQRYRAQGALLYFIGTRDVALNYFVTTSGVINLSQSGGSFNAVQTTGNANINNGGMTGFNITFSISSGNLRITLTNTVPVNFEETVIKFIA